MCCLYYTYYRFSCCSLSLSRFPRHQTKNCVLSLLAFGFELFVCLFVFWVIISSLWERFTRFDGYSHSTYRKRWFFITILLWCSTSISLSYNLYISKHIYIYIYINISLCLSILHYIVPIYFFVCPANPSPFDNPACCAVCSTSSHTHTHTLKKKRQDLCIPCFY